MVRVLPFKGYRYDLAKAGDPAKLVAPPYDVIKGRTVDELQGQSPYNIAWITKNKPRSGDSDSDNQYTRAGALWRSWLASGLLRRDDADCFYVYSQEFDIDGRRHTRFGFIGLLAQEAFATGPPADGGPFAGILQHEETLPKDIEDRLALTRATLAQFGQIFVIYPDPEGRVDEILRGAMAGPPVMEVTDGEGVRHRLWVLDGRGEIEAVVAAMADRYVIVADGHHRYKTSLAMAEERPDLPAARFTMMCFVNMSNPGLVILPTHRLVQNLEGFSREALIEGVSEHFAVRSYPDREGMFEEMRRVFSAGGHAFGMFINDGHYYALELKDEAVMDRLASDRTEAYRRLDVSILHRLVLEKVLGIGREKLAQGTMAGGGYVVYIKGIGDAVDEAIAQVRAGSQACFFMNPTRIEEVEAVATGFACMPQKSTFFYPKVWTGFVMHRLD